jgi:hypothetical protein
MSYQKYKLWRAVSAAASRGCGIQRADQPATMRIGPRGTNHFCVAAARNCLSAQPYIRVRTGPLPQIG